MSGLFILSRRLSQSVLLSFCDVFLLRFGRCQILHGKGSSPWNANGPCVLYQSVNKFSGLLFYGLPLSLLLLRLNSANLFPSFELSIVFHFELPLLFLRGFNYGAILFVVLGLLRCVCYKCL